MRLKRRLYRSRLPIRSARGYQQALGVMTFCIVVGLYLSLIGAPLVVASVTSVTPFTALQQTIVVVGISHAVLLGVLLR